MIAGQLHLGLDRPVEVEVPEEAVLVVAHGGDGRDDHPPRPAGLAHPVPPVDVLPEHAVVLFVQADGIAQRRRGAVAVYLDAVQVDDLAQAVAAELQRAGAQPEPAFAVERVLPPVVHRRRPVGHDHLRHRRAEQDRPRPHPLDVGDLVQHQALDRVQRDPQLPGAPPQLPVVDGEPGTVRLQDPQLGQLAVRRRACGVVPAGVGGQRDRVAVLELDDLAGVPVPDHDQVLDRPRVRVRARAVERVGDGSGQRPPRLVEVEPEVRGRPGVDVNGRHVGQAPPGERRQERGRLLDPLAVGHELLPGDQREHPRRGHRARHQGWLVERHRHQPGELPGPLVDHAQRLARHRSAAVVPPAHGLLGRLGQRAVHEPASGPGAVERDPRRSPGLGDGERCERVPG